MPHTYRITIQPKEDYGCVRPDRTLTFDVTNHDDLLSLVARVQQRRILPQQEVAEFTFGLKLLAEVMVRHHREPLFKELWPHFREFMKYLKRPGPTAQGYEGNEKRPGPPT
ncbi:DUF3861 domain-containing protein [Sinorhizobium americanum]|uniref:DUF3861 domain-containing protein n=1 Tax=Sinorhizobium americanum TaxID=194963 RepID=UPI0009334B2E|nr:DUF3861 domain-containing protein [Sinorhizobium americanum]